MVVPGSDQEIPRIRRSWSVAETAVGSRMPAILPGRMSFQCSGALVRSRAPRNGASVSYHEFPRAR